MGILNQILILEWGRRGGIHKYLGFLELEETGYSVRVDDVIDFGGMVQNYKTEKVDKCVHNLLNNRI